MALLSIESIAPGIQLGLWAIEDTTEQLMAQDPRLARVTEAERYHADARRREVLAVYALLFAMTGDSSKRIAHDELNRPRVDGYHVSISHTRGYAALILSRHEHVAIDIEYYSTRVARVLSKFVRPDELTPDTTSQLLHWSAKETVYKLCAEENLQYLEMRVEPMTPSPSGTLLVDDLKVPKTLDVHYRVTPDYVLTYTHS